MVDRHPILIAMIAGIALQGAALAQSTMPVGDVQRFACENDGLLAGTPFGCQLLVRTTVASFPQDRSSGTYAVLTRLRTLSAHVRRRM